MKRYFIFVLSTMRFRYTYFVFDTYVCILINYDLDRRNSFFVICIDHSQLRICVVIAQLVYVNIYMIHSLALFTSLKYILI